jgi:hypothetical protein
MSVHYRGFTIITDSCDYGDCIKNECDVFCPDGSRFRFDHSPYMSEETLVELAKIAIDEHLESVPDFGDWDVYGG